jgi:hypothetical protein
MSVTVSVMQFFGVFYKCGSLGGRRCSIEYFFGVMEDGH